MENLKVDLKKKILFLEGSRKYWWKIKHKSSSSSEEATDTRIWYTDSKKHGYLIDEDRDRDDKLEISEIEKLNARRGEVDKPIDWIPAEHRIKTPETLDRLNKLVDRAKKERRRQEAKEGKVHSHQERGSGQSMKPPSVKRVSKTEYKVDWGKYVYNRDMGEWTRRKHGDGENDWHRERDKKIRRLLEKVIAEFKEHELDRKNPKSDRNSKTFSKQEEPAPSKNPKTSSKREKPKLPELNKHGGLTVYSMHDSNYFTRFDVGKPKDYPGGFTFRMANRSHCLETVDKTSLTALWEYIGRKLKL